MGINSKIAWTDHTWNPWYGCPDDGKRSPACDNCYALAWAKRSGIVQFNREVKRASDKSFRAPLNERNFKPGDRVFVCSLSDFFHEDVPYEWYCDAFDVMSSRPDLTFMILTKRPENINPEHNWIRPDELASWGNLWLGVTAENQEQADKRIPILLGIQAAVRFVSIEPMLDEISIERYLLSSYDKAAHDPQMTGNECRFDKLDWVICGGESGHHARTIHPGWVRDLRDQCDSAGVSFFFKQWGDNPDRSAFETPMICAQIDHPKCGNMLDGKLHEDYPKFL